MKQIRTKQCYVCGEKHKKKSRFCSRKCCEWNKKHLGKKRKNEALDTPETVGKKD